jgi:hypothetical protein
MSAALTEYRCHGCDFTAHSRSQSIALHYVLPNAESVVTHRAIGWCNACGTIRDVEPDFDITRILAEIEELTKDAEPSPPKSGLFGWLRRESRQPIFEDPALARLRVHLRIANSRSTKSRCLSCGEQEVQYFRASDDGDVLNITHECGGTLFIIPDTANATRFSFRPKVLVLTNDGRIMSET